MSSFLTINVSPTTNTIFSGMPGGCWPCAIFSAVPAGIIKVISLGGRAVSRRNRKGTSETTAPSAKPSNSEYNIFFTTQFLNMIAFCISFQQYLDIVHNIIHRRFKTVRQAQISQLIDERNPRRVIDQVPCSRRAFYNLAENTITRPNLLKLRFASTQPNKPFIKMIDIFLDSLRCIPP